MCPLAFQKHGAGELQRLLHLTTSSPWHTPQVWRRQKFVCQCQGAGGSCRRRVAQHGLPPVHVQGLETQLLQRWGEVSPFHPGCWRFGARWAGGAAGPGMAAGGGVVPGLQLPAGAAAAPGRSSQSAPALPPYKRRAAARPRPFPVMAAEDRGCGLGAIRRHPPAPGAFPPPCPAASVPRGLGYRAVAAGGARMAGGADAG